MGEPAGCALPDRWSSEEERAPQDATLTEIERIIKSLDFTGTAKLDFDAADVASILKKHGVSAEADRCRAGADLLRQRQGLREPSSASVRACPSRRSKRWSFRTRRQDGCSASSPALRSSTATCLPLSARQDRFRR